MTNEKLDVVNRSWATKAGYTFFLCLFVASVLYAGIRFGVKSGEHTKIGVMDVKIYVDAMFKDNSTDQDKENIIRRISSIAKDLSDDGYIVLRADSVLSAPDDLMIDIGAFK